MKGQITMGHFNPTRQTRAEATPREWLSVGAQIGQLTNVFSGRSDVVAYVGPGAGAGGAPASFTPATAEVEVNVDVAFGKGVTPADIGDLRERSTQFEWPVATGAIFHEALHAKYSRWDMEAAYKELSPAEFRALVLLEEGRIEANGVAMTPENAGFLRASALRIVLADFAEDVANESDTVAAATLAVLSLARVDAGSLEPEDVEAIERAVLGKISKDKLDALRSIWLQAQEYANHYDARGMYDLAREWVRLVDEQAEENGDQPSQGDQQSGEAGGMMTADELSGYLSDLADAVASDADNATIGAHEQLGDQQTSEDWKKEVNERSKASQEEKEHKDASNEVFGKGTGPMPGSPTRSRLIEERMATGPERAAAVKVAHMLEKAKYRERDEVEIHSIVPPGRLRTRTMVQGAALKSKGVMTQTEPWRRTVRKHTDDPTLNVGVLVDISGSMSEAMVPMAVTAWVLSEAVRRVQGRAAMVYYGESVFPTLKPGQHLDKVNVYSAPDGTEKFNTAFKALNGSLNLLNGSGARLLVVVSDGCYTGAERKAARHWLERCQQSGTGVLWLANDDGRDAQSIINGTGTKLLTNMVDPVTVASEIGLTAARALTGASA
jgi:hypothetical protein